MSIFSSIDAEYHREILKNVVAKLEHDDLDQDIYTRGQVDEILDNVVQRFNQECVE